MSSYLMHYSPNAGKRAVYDPRAESLNPRHARLRPPCRIRGRKDVTSILESVTCTACASHAEARAAKLASA